MKIPIRTPQLRNRTVLTCWLFALVFLMSGLASAQTVMTLAPGFHPQSLTGVAGGPQNASTHTAVDGQSCPGWIAHTANHQINLVGPIELTIEVESSIDTTLALWGPDGWRCNDDIDGYNPAIRDTLGIGSYSIFVGAYNEGQSAPYSLLLGEGHAPTAAEAGSSGDPAALDTSSTTANFGSHAVGSMGGPAAAHVLSGSSGGPIDSSGAHDAFSGPCSGWVNANPNHLLEVTSYQDYLRLAVTSEGDTTLVVHGPSGFLCNDDAYGIDPELEGQWVPGIYRIWVGSYYDGQNLHYELEISQFPRGEMYVLELTFQGAFEGTDVFFSGPDAATIYTECMGYAVSANTGFVDDVVIFGVSHHNGPSYWGDEVLCAMAAANARPRLGECPVVVAGQIEDLPFAFCGATPDMVRQAVAAYAPVLAASGMIDDITVDGVPHHNGPSYWDAGQVTSMILSSVVDPMAGLVARGDIEGLPFVFSGNSAAEIRAQCEAFVHSMDLSMVDDINVNGEHRHNGPSYWNPAEICMIVSSLAR